jgi:hypothetical protein
MSSRFDKEKTRKNIALVLKRIRSDVDPQLLAEYRRIFKKETSLFRRSWAAAYLLMLFDQQEGGRKDKGRSRRNASDRNVSESRAPAAAAAPRRRDDEARVYPLPEEESRWLFMSIGRNRRVFPREILGLILSKTTAPREDIGAIRILNNYLFVQVRDTVADLIIEALDGFNFRGRALAVNYAKSKKYGTADGAEDGEDDYVDDSAGEDGNSGDAFAESAGDAYSPEPAEEPAEETRADADSWSDAEPDAETPDDSEPV